MQTLPQAWPAMAKTHDPIQAMHITEKSSKDEVITAAVEITDQQAQLIDELRSQQTLLFVFVGVLSCVVLMNS